MSLNLRRLNRAISAVEGYHEPSKADLRKSLEVQDALAALMAEHEGALLKSEEKGYERARGQALALLEEALIAADTELALLRASRNENDREVRELDFAVGVLETQLDRIHAMTNQKEEGK